MILQPFRSISTARRVGVLVALGGAVLAGMYTLIQYKVGAVHLTEAGVALCLKTRHLVDHDRVIAFYCIEPHMVAWYWYDIEGYRAPHVHMVRFGQWEW